MTSSPDSNEPSHSAPAHVPVPPPRTFREKVKGGLQSVVDGIATMGQAAVSWGLWLLVIAGAVGSGLWFHDHPDFQRALEDNKVDFDTRLSSLKWSGIALGAIGVLFVTTLCVRRLLHRKWLVHETGASLSGWLAGGIAVPMIVALEMDGMEVKSSKLSLLLALVAAIAVMVTAYQCCGAFERLWSIARVPRILERLRPAAGHASLLVALGVWAAYAWFFSNLSVTNHHAMNTRTVDLGLYDNIFHQSSHGDFLGCTFVKTGYHGSAHFDPILVLLSPLYLLHPKAELLLILQSIWVGSGVIPIYLLTSYKLNSRIAGLVMGLVYALHPAVHGANMYEFHSLTLAGPVISWVLYFLERGAWRHYWFALVIALLVREDISLLLCFVGAASLLHPDRKNRNHGLATIVASLVYFAIVKTFFMTSPDVFMDDNEQAHGFAHYYADLMPGRRGVGELLGSVWTNPVFVVRHVMSEAKLLFFATVFLPLLLLPFWAKRRRLMLLYGLIFIFFASRSAVYSTHFQYTSILLPIAIAITPDALLRLRESAPALWNLSGSRFVQTLVVGCLVACALVSWKHGAIVDNDSFRGGIRKISRELDEAAQARYRWVQETVALIPADSSVGVTDTTGPHVSNRARVMFYGEELPAYVFIDEMEIKKYHRMVHEFRVKRKRLVELARYGTLVLFQNAGAETTRPTTPPRDLIEPHSR